jgi:hypothetical protein
MASPDRILYAALIVYGTGWFLGNWTATSRCCCSC